jgi:PKD repeat protein
MLILFFGPGLLDVSNGTPLPSPPVTDFSVSRFTGNVPLSIDFTDLSTNSPTSWSWDFGDSSTSTAQNPSHTYTVAGTYTVSLTATNAIGSDTETKTALLTFTDPTPFTPGGSKNRIFHFFLRRR